MSTYDFIIAGAGIVGLTTAFEILQRAPASRVAIVEKEAHTGCHASGRNSGVLHCGLYYGSNTLKAKVCAVGGKSMKEFADAHNIPCFNTGKVLVATHSNQLPAVERLMRNAVENGIRAERIDNKTLLEIEPAAPSDAVAAIYCPDTSVIDVKAVLETLRARLADMGVSFHFQRRIDGPTPDGALRTTNGPIRGGFLFNCGGAYADVLAKAHGFAKNYCLVPFKGIYWKLSPEKNPLVRGNIYPVPDISMPFLGVHFTRGISGDVYVGPTAIPALGRENYGRVAGARLGESLTVLGRLGLLYLANQNNFRLLAHTELRKYSKTFFHQCATRLFPGLAIGDLVPTAKCGIRPQLVNVISKQLEMDYVFEGDKRSIHVLNAISPAFTSSFAFARMIVEQSEAL